MRGVNPFGFRFPPITSRVLAVSRRSANMAGGKDRAHTAAMAVSAMSIDRSAPGRLPARMPFTDPPIRPPRVVPSSGEMILMPVSRNRLPLAFPHVKAPDDGHRSCQREAGFAPVVGLLLFWP